MDPSEYERAIRTWLDDNGAVLEPFRVLHAGSFEDDIARDRTLQRLLYDAGWNRWGWPESHGGFGGPIMLRGITYEALAAAGVAYPHFAESFEIIGSTLVSCAPELAREHLARGLRGEEIWSQGFSEPNAGSDLASLRTRAVDDGTHFRVNGQKVWQSFGHVSRWCIVLVRTGDLESRHRGLSMLWIDLELPGVTVQPIRAANGRNELAEVFLDDVLVPKTCLVGALGEGWGVAMYLLQFERGMYCWMRQALLHTRLEHAVRSTRRPADEAAALVGPAQVALGALRMRARETLLRLNDGAILGPETSVDKILLSTAEQAVYDAARALSWPDFELGDDDEAAMWRAEWFYSRSTSIFGGTTEVQHDIVAERLLGLPRLARRG
jgi:alkylation response protein AidB-like acyl-CoA dehydrogenase